MDQDWRDIYIPRERELGQLKDYWETAKSGKPVICAVIAERGFGKTRLAQEFYRWLSTTEDQVEPEGYWPDNLGSDLNNLRVNPVMPSPNDMSSNHLPYMWWGLRLVNRSDRNQQFGTALTDGQRILQDHLWRYHIVQKRSALEKKKTSEQKKVVVDVGTEIISNLTTFGLLGTIKDIGEFGLQMKALEDELDELEQHSDSDQTNDILDIIMADLDRVCKTPPPGFKPIPVCILVDDAQWLGQDKMMNALVERLVSESIARNWPIMILFTCWEREWSGLNGTGLYSQLRSYGCEPAQIMIDKLELKRIIDAGLPGLTEKQAERIQRKVDGNPRYLDMILGLLRKRTGLFVDSDPHQKLTAAGEAYLDEKSHDQIVFDRLLDSPVEVQKVVGAASLQGVSFSPYLAVGTARRLAVGTGKDAMNKADNPYAFISVDKQTGEFRHRAIWRAAKDHLPNLVDVSQAEEAYRDALLNDKEMEEDVRDDLIAQQFDSDDIVKREAGGFALSRIIHRAMDQKQPIIAQDAAKAWVDCMHSIFPRLSLTGDFGVIGNALSGSEYQKQWVALGEKYVAHWLPDQSEEAIQASFGGMAGYLISSSQILCNGLSRYWVNPNRERNIQLARIAVQCGRELIKRAGTSRGEVADFKEAIFKSTSFQRRDLRISLQRYTDLLEDGAEKLELVKEQVDLVKTSAPKNDVYIATSDLYNSLNRLAGVQYGMEMQSDAIATQVQATNLWRPLVEKTSAQKLLMRLAQAISHEVPFHRTGKKANRAQRALCEEGIAVAIRAYHLLPSDSSATNVIQGLTAWLKRKALDIPSFRAFLTTGEKNLKAYQDKEAQQGLNPFERDQAINLAMFFGDLNKYVKNIKKEAHFRRVMIELMKGKMGHEDRSSLQRNFAVCNGRLAFFYLKRMKLRDSWRHYKQSQVHFHRALEILESNGLEFSIKQYIFGGMPDVYFREVADENSVKTKQ